MMALDLKIVSGLRCLTFGEAWTLALLNPVEPERSN